MSSNGASGSGSKGSKKSDRDLDLENSHRGVWLVKVPKYISDRWEKAAANTEVGKLRINKIPGQKPDVNFTLADSICAPVAGLSEFDKNALVNLTFFHNLHAFTFLELNMSLTVKFKTEPV